MAPIEEMWWFPSQLEWMEAKSFADESYVVYIFCFKIWIRGYNFLESFEIDNIILSNTIIIWKFGRDFWIEGDEMGYGRQFTPLIKSLIEKMNDILFSTNWMFGQRWSGFENIFLILSL